MNKWSPKSESTLKIEQDRPFSKNLTFDQRSMQKVKINHWSKSTSKASQWSKLHGSNMGSSCWVGLGNLR